MVSLCVGNYWWGKDSSTEKQDCRESCKYVDQGGNGNQVWALSKLDQYSINLKNSQRRQRLEDGLLIVDSDLDKFWRINFHWGGKLLKIKLCGH